MPVLPARGIIIGLTTWPIRANPPLPSMPLQAVESSRLYRQIAEQLRALISGGLAGLMAVNVVLGDHGKLQIEFPSGAGFVGIAVALMGRSHPVGIVIAAILFGILYQGGAELAFWVPNISREMIILIQGLVVLFAGALENMFRPAMVRLFARRPRAVPKAA